MRLYDEVLSRWEDMLTGKPLRSLPVTTPLWPEAGDGNMVLRSDMAFELGGGTMSALGATAVTTVGVEKDEILLLGKDLPELRGDTPYARLAVVRTDDSLPTEPGALYRTIKQIGFVRYHVSPEGFMPRISVLTGRESARVSREALKKGLDFSEVGSLMAAKFHENSRIQAVRLIFITDPEFDFSALTQTIRTLESITRAIDHAASTPMSDCNTCGLKKVCDEVEGIRELHFGTKE